MLSLPHLVIIFLIVLLVFGPQKLPELARMLGKAMADFRRVTFDVRRVVEDEMREMERAAREADLAKREAVLAEKEKAALPGAPAQDQSETAPPGAVATEPPNAARVETAADGASQEPDSPENNPNAESTHS